MFRFNFGGGGADPPPPRAGGGVYTAPAKEEELTEEALAGHPVPVESLTIAPGLTLKKGIISNAQAAAALGSQEMAENDLIPGEYEGGFKQWEGGVDLAKYLAGQLQAKQLLQGGASCRAIELGCGHGLPSLVALRHGAEVHCQDYNSHVLHLLTMPNVLANLRVWSAQHTLPPQRPVRFFSGSWDGLAGLLEQKGLAGSYDLVLTAETIYSPEATRSLLQCIKRCLRRPSGVALVAAKSHYFGVGGGIADFLQLVESDGTLDACTVWTMDDGRSNSRSILQLTFAAS